VADLTDTEMKAINIYLSFICSFTIFFNMNFLKILTLLFCLFPSALLDFYISATCELQILQCISIPTVFHINKLCCVDMLNIH